MLEILPLLDRVARISNDSFPRLLYLALTKPSKNIISPHTASYNSRRSEGLPSIDNSLLSVEQAPPCLSKK